MHRVLPGRLMTMDEQCQRKMGTNACAVCKVASHILHRKTLTADYNDSVYV